MLCTFARRSDSCDALELSVVTFLYGLPRKLTQQSPSLFLGISGVNMSTALHLPSYHTSP